MGAFYCVGYYLVEKLDFVDRWDAIDVLIVEIYQVFLGLDTYN